MENKDLTQLTNKYLKETDENIVGVSYGFNRVDGKITKEKVISFTVKNKLPLNEIDPTKVIPKTITHLGETFQTDVTEGDIKKTSTRFCYDEHYTWWEYWQPVPTIPSNQDTIRPLKGGVSISNYTRLSNYAGTLGFIAIDSETNSFVGVTNNHIIVDRGFQTSERSETYPTNIARNVVSQPLGSSRIGEVKKYVPLSGTTNNTVDAALSTIDDGMIDLNESWKQEGLTISNPMPFATTAEIDNILDSGSLLYSSGRSSGAKGELNTKLVPYEIAGSYDLWYTKDTLNDTLITFDNCIAYVASGTTITPGDTCFFPITDGDSGSALIADIGGTKKIIGLSFAGAYYTQPLDPNDPQSEVVQMSYKGIACRIDKVAEQLNIEAWTGQTGVNYSNTSATEECVVTGKTNVKSFIKEGKTFWQVGLTNSTNICHTLP